MGENGDLPDLGILGERLQGILESVSRIGRALAIIGVGEQLAARRPGKKDRHGRGTRIVHDLSETVNSLIETVIVAMDENKNTPAGSPGEKRMQPRNCHR